MTMISTAPLEDFLTVQDLSQLTPDIQSAHPLGTSKAPRGDMIYLNCEERLSTLGVLEIRPELGPRGRHMHLHKKEIFYIITGKMQGRYWHDHNPNQGYVFDHGPGHLITIQPGLFHEFIAIEPTWAVEFSPQIFNISDTVYPQETPFDS